jgi:hypothetical protein
MERQTSISPGRWLALAALLCTATLGIAPAPSPTSAPTARATCVFTNPAFAGKCTETAGIPEGSSAQQACDSILRCLNDVQCLKTYCQATTIRSGWKLESAQATRATP